MNQESLKKILSKLHQQKITPESAYELLQKLPFENLNFAHLDHHRSIRNGMPEVIYCEGKTTDQIISIIKSFNKTKQDILATRLSPKMFKSIKNRIPKKAQYDSLGKTLTIKKKKKSKKVGEILILTAGTSDIPVALEASVTADLLGSKVETIFDVGVAGIHRLFDKFDLIRKAKVIIVVAGMDGALLSVVGGLVDKPVIGVPTSIGYGASFEGLAPLLTMLNSCSSGVGTVNIDNGFGAACLAHKINLLGEP